MQFLCVVFAAISCLYSVCFVDSLRTIPSASRIQYSSSILNANIGGDRWRDFDGLRCRVLGPVTVLKHLGDYTPYHEENIDSKNKAKFNLNVGKALETLRRELPMVFYVSNLDFSIFANQITVADGTNQNKMVMQKSLYVAAVKSLRMASALSFICPSMNVRKIEYVENCRTIQCLVDVVLPDTVRIDGQAVWEGMIYFGLDTEGLIDSQIFDRKISNHRPASPQNAKMYPWFNNQWGGDFVPQGLAFPQPSYASSSSTPTDEVIPCLDQTAMGDSDNSNYINHSSNA